MSIDREGTFRGTVNDWGVSESSGGFPQFVCRLHATEYYDEIGAYGKPGTWLDWASYGQDIVAYLVLFNAKGPLQNAKQLQEALGWDGGSFQSLNDGDWSKSVIQFRVADEEFEGTTRRKVQWVSKHDADPNRSIRKLDPKALKGLDARFNLGGLPKPPPAAPAPAPAATPPAATPAPAPAPAATPAPAPAPAAPAENLASPTCTKEEAWAVVHKLKMETVNDDALGTAWIAACETVFGDAGENEATPEQWAQVRNKTLDQIDSVPF